MFSASARKAMSIGLVVAFLAGLIVVGAGAFFVGQNFSVMKTTTSDGQDTSALQTVQTITTTQTLLVTQTQYVTQSDTSSGQASKTQTTQSTTSNQDSTAQSTGSTTTSSQSSNALAITLESGSLFAGTMGNSAGTANETGSPYVTMSLNNPGAKTSITSFGISVTGFGESATSAYCTSGKEGTCNSLSTNIPSLAGNAITSLTLYFYGSGNITSGDTYNYLINFANGQSFSGSLTAQ
jgi:hypothetical protein